MGVNKYKKLVKLILLSFFLLLVGCSKLSGLKVPYQNNTGTYIPVNNAPEPKPDSDTLILRMAENLFYGHPTSVGDEEFARLVDKYSGGRIKVIVYYGAKLGTENSTAVQVQFGGIDLARVHSASMADIAPNLNILALPYLFRDSEHLWKVLNGPVGDEILNSLDKYGIIGMAYYDSGARCFYTKKPLYKLSDMKNLRIRVQLNNLYTDLVSALGATPIQLPFSDVYSAFQTNTIDGAENNLSSYLSNKHNEQAKYLTIDNHTRAPEILIASKIVMDKLSPEDRNIIIKAAKDSVGVQRQAFEQYEKQALEEVKKSGTTVIELSDTEREQFKDAAVPLYNTYGKEYKEIVDRIRDTN